MTIAKLEKHILTYADRVAKELTVSEKSSAEFPELFHISMDSSIKVFTPRLSEYQLEGEDRSVPRVVTAPTLLGCILGYAHVQHDYLHKPVKDEGNDIWKNGYYIYKFDYDVALKPSNELVPIATQTDETWLVGYSPDNNEYPSKKIGKFFVKEFKFKVAEGDSQDHDVETTILVEITDPEGMQFSKNKKLDKGYWLIEMFDVHKDSWMTRSWTEDKDISIKEISKEDWLASKNAIASMLNYEDPIIQPPAYLLW